MSQPRYPLHFPAALTQQSAAGDACEEEPQSFTSNPLMAHPLWWWHSRRARWLPAAATAAGRLSFSLLPSTPAEGGNDRHLKSAAAPLRVRSASCSGAPLRASPRHHRVSHDNSGEGCTLRRLRRRRSRSLPLIPLALPPSALSPDSDSDAAAGGDTFTEEPGECAWGDACATVGGAECLRFDYLFDPARDRLGGGAFSAVYRAIPLRGRSSSRRAPVALKVFHCASEAERREADGLLPLPAEEAAPEEAEAFAVLEGAHADFFPAAPHNGRVAVGGDGGISKKERRRRAEEAAVLAALSHSHCSRLAQVCTARLPARRRRHHSHSQQHLRCSNSCADTRKEEPQKQQYDAVVSACGDPSGEKHERGEETVTAVVAIATELEAARSMDGRAMLKRLEAARGSACWQPPLREAAVGCWLAQLCATLADLHGSADSSACAAPVTHMDVKLENLIFSELPRDAGAMKGEDNNIHSRHEQQQPQKWEESCDGAAATTTTDAAAYKVTLIDFGLSRRATRVSAPANKPGPPPSAGAAEGAEAWRHQWRVRRQSGGTLRYMPPEAFDDEEADREEALWGEGGRGTRRRRSGRGRDTPLTAAAARDVYALGVVAHALLSGAFPPSPLDAADGCPRRLCRGPAWEGVSEGARRSVRALLEPLPGRRPSAAAALATLPLLVSGAAAAAARGLLPAGYAPRATAERDADGTLASAADVGCGAGATPHPRAAPPPPALTVRVTPSGAARGRSCKASAVAAAAAPTAAIHFGQGPGGDLFSQLLADAVM